MILLIDNYDSFTHNLARHFVLTGRACRIARNDAISIAEIQNFNPEAVVISPGPGRPEDSGICVDLIRSLGPAIPILGVCLGHQCIGHAFGARIARTAPMHGRASAITHDGSALFHGLPGTFSGGRYHSLAIAEPVPSDLIVTARADDNTIMAVRHARYPVHGVQFHPESLLTEHGMALIENFCALAAPANRTAAA